MSDLLLSLGMICALALLVGGVAVWRGRGERRNGLLMIVAALVIAANVAIWSMPAPQSAVVSR